MKLLKILGIFVGVIVLALGGVLAYIATLDPNELAQDAAVEVREATGRDFTINGPVDLAVSLQPTLEVENVAFGNAAWGSEPTMASIGRLEVEIALLPLLSGQVDIARLVLVEPNILLERQADGTANWDIAPGGKADSASGEEQHGGEPGEIPVIRAVTIENATIRIRDAVTPIEETITISELSLAQAAGQKLDVTLLAAIGDEELSVEGQTGDLAVLAQRFPFPLDLAIGFGPATATLKGSLTLTEKPGYAGSLSLKTPSLAAFNSAAALAGADALPDLGPIDVRADLTVEGDVAKVTALDGSVAGVTMTGEITADQGGAEPQATLALTVAAETLATLGALAETALPEVGPFQLTVNGEAAPSQVDIQNLTLTLGEDQLSGRVTAAMAGERPSVDVALTGNSLDLGPFLEGGAESGEAPAATAGSGDGRVIPDDPLPLDGLKAVDAVVALKLGVLKVGGPEVKNIDLALALKNGDLKITTLKANGYGGSIDATLDLMTSGGTPSLKTSGGFRDIDLGGVLADEGITDLLVGTLDGTWTLSGQGASPRAIAASLDGETRLELVDGSVQSGFVDFIAADVVSQAGKVFAGKEQTPLNCFYNQFKITDGVANAHVLLFDTERSTIAGAGEINLGTEEMGMKISPQPKEASLVSLALPVLVEGTFASPNVYPDPTAVAAGAAGIAAGVATGGLAGVLVPFLSSGGGDQGCAEALAVMDGKPLPKPEKKSGVGGLLDSITGGGASGGSGEGATAPQQPAVPAAEDAVKGLTDGLKNLFE
ncbi:MAG: AsmA family protein [Alphaproteobacteria bacterium]|nr:AsmA family protein [Alphaproteobacteria bacterium]